jgi:hypothetical protein
MLATTDLIRRSAAERRQSGGRHFFNANASAADLGIFVRLGSTLTADYNISADVFFRIRREFDPNFRPLWSNVLWQSPNGSLFWTGHHVLARYVPHPSAEHELAQVILPSTRVHGVTYKHPIVIANTLDGLTDKERGRIPGRYVPIDERIFAYMKERAWRVRNMHTSRGFAENRRLQKAAIAKAAASRGDEFAYRRASIEPRLRRLETGTEDRVYVTESAAMKPASAEGAVA